MAPLFVNFKRLVCAKDLVTKGALVRECVGEVNGLHMIPHIGEVEYSVMAELTTNSPPSIISDDVLFKIFRSVDCS